MKKVLSFFIYTILFTGQAAQAAPSAIWSEIDTFLGAHKIEGTIKKLVEEEVRLSIPTIEYLRSQKKDEEIKGLVKSWKKSIEAKHRPKSSVFACVKELQGLESEYKSFVNHYDQMFQKLQNPLYKVLEEVKVVLRGHLEYNQWNQAWLAQKTAEDFDRYFELGEMLVKNVNLDVAKSLNQFKRQQNLHYLAIELDHDFRLDGVQSGGLLLCGKKGKDKWGHSFCLKLETPEHVVFSFGQNPRNPYYSAEKFLQTHGLGCLAKIKIDLFEKLAYR